MKHKVVIARRVFKMSKMKIVGWVRTVKSCQRSVGVSGKTRTD
jgi:hypothetical protein